MSPSLVDPFTGDRRPATQEDVDTLVRIARAYGKLTGLLREAQTQASLIALDEEPEIQAD